MKRYLIIILVIINLGLVYWNSRISKEVKTLRETQHLLSECNGRTLESLGFCLSEVTALRIEIKKLEKKSKTFY